MNKKGRHTIRTGHSQQARSQQARHGAVAVDVAITLAVMMVIAMAAYKMAIISLTNLHHVISVMFGSPYL